MLQVEEPGVVGVAVVHLLAHRQDLGAQRRLVARAGQDVGAQRLEGAADGRAAGCVACPGQRLMLPHPGRFGLIDPEGVLAGNQQAGVAVGAQAQVHLEERAGRRARLQPAGHALCQLGIDTRGVLVRVVVEEHQVQVG